MVVKMPDILDSFGVRKTLPLTKFLNTELNKLRGSGVLQNILTIPKKNCPLDEVLMQITFPKTIFLFTVFVVGAILSIIIFFCERIVSKDRQCALEKPDEKQFNTINGRILNTNEIGVQCNIGHSVAIGSKNIMIY